MREDALQVVFLVDDNDDDEGDRPLEGVTIELLDGEGNSIDSDPADETQATITTTDSEGNYEFSVCYQETIR